MSEHQKVIESSRKAIYSDRWAVFAEINQVQNMRPAVSTNLKTSEVVTAVLKSMYNTVGELRASGFLDSNEYMLLFHYFEDRLKTVRSGLRVPVVHPKSLFHEIAWLDSNEIALLLYEQVKTKIWNAGDIIINEGDHIDGIYLVVAGLFKITYNPTQSMMRNMTEYGQLPIKDHICDTRFNEARSDIVQKGSSIGELSILTDRPYESVVQCLMPSQALIIPKQHLRYVMNLYNDPINGLEAKMWKYILFRIGTSLLIDNPSNDINTFSNAALCMERSFVPDLSNYKMLVITELVEDVILIEGIVVDYNTRDVYVAPCYLPRSAQTLILPSSSRIKFDTLIATRVAILPTKDADKYEVMESVEQISELVENPVNLVHNIRKKQKTKIKRRMKSKSKVAMSRVAVAISKGKFQASQKSFGSSTESSSMSSDTVHSKSVMETSYPLSKSAARLVSRTGIGTEEESVRDEEVVDDEKVKISDLQERMKKKIKGERVGIGVGSLQSVDLSLTRLLKKDLKGAPITAVEESLYSQEVLEIFVDSTKENGSVASDKRTEGTFMPRRMSMKRRISISPVGLLAQLQPKKKRLNKIKSTSATKTISTTSNLNAFSRKLSVTSKTSKRISSMLSVSSTKSQASRLSERSHESSGDGYKNTDRWVPPSTTIKGPTPRKAVTRKVAPEKRSDETLYHQAMKTKAALPPLLDIGNPMDNKESKMFCLRKRKRHSLL